MAENFRLSMCVSKMKAVLQAEASIVGGGAVPENVVRVPFIVFINKLSLLLFSNLAARTLSGCFARFNR